MTKRCFSSHSLSFRAEVFVRDLQQPYLGHNATIKPRFLAPSDKVVADSKRIGIDHSCCFQRTLNSCASLREVSRLSSLAAAGLGLGEPEIRQGLVRTPDLDDSASVTGAKNATIIGPVTSMAGVFSAERSATNPNNTYSPLP